jgi:predicted nuclease of predicted toxin-antitoxin system
MQFKVDENLPREISSLLREAGHDAVTVGEQQMRGAPDPNLAVVCQRESRALVTLDTDFADIRVYPPEEYPGLVVLRLDRQDKPHVLSVFKGVILMLASEPLDGHLWIVEPHRVRMRSGRPSDAEQ